MSRSSTLALATVLLSAACTDRVEPTRPDAPTAAAEQSLAATGVSYIVAGKEGGALGTVVAAARAAGGVVVATIPELNVALVRAAGGQFQAQVEGSAGVEAALPNLSVERGDPVRELAGTVTASALLPPASGQDDVWYDAQWAHAALQVPSAWALGARGAGARVAILDDGVRSTHLDIAPNLNGALSTSFVEGETYDNPPGGHGTHVAGIVAAADNEVATIGVAPQAEIVMIKVISAVTGSGSFFAVLQGLVHAGNVGADVINMSLGAYLPRSAYWTEIDGEPVFIRGSDTALFLKILNRGTKYAWDRGATLIASAGNERVDGDHTADLVHIPSGLSNVLTIAATGPLGWGPSQSVVLDRPAGYSNFGQSWIDFAAPGGDAALPGIDLCQVAGTFFLYTAPCWVFDMVVSTGAGSNTGIAFAAGTSMAAPHAAGVAALIVGRNGGSMSPAAVVQALRASADDLGKPGNDDRFGGGRVNARRAAGG